MTSIRLCVVGLALLACVRLAGAAGDPASKPAKPQPVDFTKLKEVMPEVAVGVERSSHDGENVSVGEMAMSKARADYTKPDSDGSDPNASIEIVDFINAPQMALAMTSWRSMPIKIENDQGFQRTVKFKDLPAFQTYEKEGESRQMLVMVADRFLVTLSTNHVNEEEFNRFAESFPVERLAALK